MTTVESAAAPVPIARLERQGPWRLALAVVGVAAVLRVLFLFLSPLELYPDEAQYWVWSRTLDFGYFSKPPMIAWLIRATTAIGGDGEAWIRLSAPLLHAGAALALYRAAARLYDGWTGFWTALFYTLVPGVLLSSAVIATDAPLMLFISLAVWAYAVLWGETTPQDRLRAATGLGAALGAAFLTKYAALYIVGGVALHAALSREARARWSPASLAACVGAALVIAAPNLFWNLAHHFQTVAHTAENADLGGERGLNGLFGARGPFGFLFGQFGVFGPVPFAFFLLAAAVVVRRRGQAPDLLLLCLAAPAFLIVFGESIIARANANWAGAGYPAALILAVAAMRRWEARGWRMAGLVLQLLIFVGFFLGILIPGAADAVGAGAAFKRARGWRADTAAIIAAAGRAGARQPLTAIAVDDRFLFNALSYYGRDHAGRSAGALPAPLKAWVHLAKASNQAEAEAPLTPASGTNALAVSANAPYLPAFKADFAHILPVEPPRIRVRLDRKHDRELDLFIGQSFSPRPRDLKTGLPLTP